MKRLSAIIGAALALTVTMAAHATDKYGPNGATPYYTVFHDQGITDPATGAEIYVPVAYTGGGGGGGGGAVTAAAGSYVDGALFTEGFTTDTACTTDNGTCTMEALIKRTNQRLTTINTTLGTPFQAGGSIGNTAFGATQSGTWNVGLNAGSNAIGSITNTSFAATQSGTWNVGLSAGSNTIGAVTGTGTAGTPAGGVLTVQGVTSMTALKVDGSGVTQPVSGTVTVTQATAANLNATVTGTVTAAQATAANLNATVVQATASNFNAQVVGNVANGATDAGNPVEIGGLANSSAPSAVTAGQRVRQRYDLFGSAAGFLNDGLGNIIYSSAASTDIEGASSNKILEVRAQMGLYDPTGAGALPALRGIPSSQSSGIGTAAVAIGPTSAAAGSITPTVSAAASTSLVLKASAGNVYDFYCASTAAGFCILYNATTAPGAGALTSTLVLDCIPVAAAGYGSANYNVVPERASTGAVVLFSSGASCNTYTASSTAYIHGRVQ